VSDLRHHVLAENITKEHEPSNRWRVEFDFLCPNCGRYHKSKEIGIGGIFGFVEYELACGHVKVRMPSASHSTVAKAATNLI
jgi:hypothetical protein